MKPQKRWVMRMVVEGSGDFPIDMLRYDTTVPASEQDSHLIDERYSHHEKRRVILRRFALEDDRRHHRREDSWMPRKRMLDPLRRP